MTAGEQIEGVALHGRPRRRRPIVLEPRPTRCVCGTDTEVGPCPRNCPTREVPR